MSDFFRPADPIDLLPEVLTGVVVRVITEERPGRVKFRGSYWPAALYQDEEQIVILPDERVNIIAMQGITLLVRPLHQPTME